MAMAVSGLNAGLTWSDMSHMKFTHLMLLLYEWEDMHGSETDEVVDARPSDVSMLMAM